MYREANSGWGFGFKPFPLASIARCVIAQTASSLLNRTAATTSSVEDPLFHG
jgi:hypothetical protein